MFVLLNFEIYKNLDILVFWQYLVIVVFVA